MIFSHIAFVRGWSILGFNCFQEEGRDACLTTRDLTIGNEFALVFIYLWLAWLFYMVAAWYLDQVIPQKYGVPRSPFFLISSPYKWFRRTFSGKKEIEEIDPDDEVAFDKSHEMILMNEDEDVRAERSYVQNNENLKAAVVIRGLSKVYSSRKHKKVAVNNLFLHMEYGQIFGLLGPNGAGKSTLISMLTGIYTQTSGTASVHGFDTAKEIESVHLSLGYCPQHDILWNDLTVKEHLLFYARLKGIAPADEDQEAEEWATRLGLEKFLDRQAGKMSGGQQRRLSIGNALIGSPDIVLLDEPSTVF